MITEERIAAIATEFAREAKKPWPHNPTLKGLASGAAAVIRLALAEERGRQPMSTAPRDGRDVLLHTHADVGNLFLVARWNALDPSHPWVGVDGHEAYRDDAFDGWHELPEDGA